MPSNSLQKSSSFYLGDLPGLLHASVRNGRNEAVALILQNRHQLEININQTFESGYMATSNYTYLMLACLEGHFEICRLLLQEPDLDTNITNDCQETAFNFACQQKHEDIVELLMTNSTKYNIDLNTTDNFGKSGYDYWPEKFPNHFK